MYFRGMKIAYDINDWYFKQWINIWMLCNRNYVFVIYINNDDNIG
jgi:hypothetical protein